MPITNHLALSSTNVVVSAGFSQNSARHEDSWKVVPLILDFVCSPTCILDLLDYIASRANCVQRFKANLLIEAICQDQ